MKNARRKAEFKKAGLTLPIMTAEAPEFFGPLLEEQMVKVSEGVERSAVFGERGHSVALEAEDRLAAMLRGFTLGR